MSERRFAQPLVLLATAALLCAWSGTASAATAPAQEQSGSIALPLRFAADATYSSWPGGQRTVYTVAGSNGQVGYTIDLSEAVDGGRFELVGTGGLTGLEDLDSA